MFTSILSSGVHHGAGDGGTSMHQHGDGDTVSGVRLELVQDDTAHVLAVLSAQALLLLSSSCHVYDVGHHTPLQLLHGYNKIVQYRCP